MQALLDKFFQADCIEFMKNHLPDESLDLVFADPPYNLSGNGLKWKGKAMGGDWHMVNESWDQMSASDYLAFTDAWISECVRALKPAGSIYVSCAYHNIAEVMSSLRQLGLKINNVITWHKSNAMPNMTRRVFTHCTEFVVWAVRGTGWTFNYEELKEINPELRKDGARKQMRDVWSLPLVQGKERLKGKNNRAAHPTQKPEELLKRIIVASSHPGETVFDPFAGSGTTLAVASRLGRRWIGTELNQDYVSLIERRLKKRKARLPRAARATV